MSIEKIPMQMSEYEVYKRLARDESCSSGTLESWNDSCPIDICIDKYKMFKKWCEYQIEQSDFKTLKWDAELNGANCALCIVNNDDCDVCVLSKIKMECCPDKCTISPWLRVRYACNFIDETEERQQELYDAIDNMISVLEQCKEVEL